MFASGRSFDVASYAAFLDVRGARKRQQPAAGKGQARGIINLDSNVADSPPHERHEHTATLSNPTRPNSSARRHGTSMQALAGRPVDGTGSTASQESRPHIPRPRSLPIRGGKPPGSDHEGLSEPRVRDNQRARHAPHVDLHGQYAVRPSAAWGKDPIATTSTAVAALNTHIIPPTTHSGRTVPAVAISPIVTARHITAPRHTFSPSLTGQTRRAAAETPPTASCPTTSTTVATAATYTVPRTPTGRVRPAAKVGAARASKALYPNPGLKESSRTRGSSQEDIVECELCGKNLREKFRHPCKDCSIIICPGCVANAPILHREHTISPTAMLNRTHGRQDAERRAQDEGPSAQASSTYTCFICQRHAAEDVCYRCLDCGAGTEVTNICKLCRKLHPEEHQVVAYDHSPGINVEGQGEQDAESSFLMEDMPCVDDTVCADDHDTEAAEDAVIHIASDGDDDQGMAGRMISRSRKRRRVSLGKEADSDDDRGKKPALDRPAARAAARGQPPPFSRDDLKRFVSLARAMAQRLGYEDLDELDDEDEEEERDGRDSEPQDLLDFQPLDLSLTSPHKRRKPGSRVTSHHQRRWSSQQKQELAEMMAEGYEIEEVAAALRRTPGAVVQQWSKQKGEQGRHRSEP